MSALLALLCLLLSISTVLSESVIGIDYSVQAVNTSVISWPGGILNRPCTNPNPQPNEYCTRSCYADSDCMQYMYCFRYMNRPVGFCTCAATSYNALFSPYANVNVGCDANSICMQQDGDQLARAHCFCRNDAGCNNHGSCAISMTWWYTPDSEHGGQGHMLQGLSWTTNRGSWNEVPYTTTQTAYTTSNLEWAVYNTPAYATNAAAVQFNIIPDGSTWSHTVQEIIDFGAIQWTTTPNGWRVGFPALSFTPPTCNCNDGWHGATCNNQIDQAHVTLCGDYQAVQTSTSSDHYFSMPNYVNPNPNPDPNAPPPGYLWSARVGIISSDPLNHEMTLVSSSSVLASTLNPVYCMCPYGWGPFAVQRQSFNSLVLAPGTACTIPNYDIIHCSKYTTLGTISILGTWNRNHCVCNVGLSGPACNHSCRIQYCSSHLPPNVDCAAVGGQNTCASCLQGWGPSQDGTMAVEMDPFYNQIWCALPYGLDYTSDASGQQLECNGAGFAVDVSMILFVFGIPSTFNLIAFMPESMFRHFNTHPVYILPQLTDRYPPLAANNATTLARMDENYRQYYNTITTTTCMQCDPGFQSDGSSCKPADCAVWDQCDQSDYACIEFTSAPYPLISTRYFTSLQCGGTMYAGSLAPRGVCVVITSSIVNSLTCVCSNGYGGHDCGKVLCSWANGQSCAGHGTCNAATNRCVCRDGWVGMACEIQTSAGACHEHGQVQRVYPSFVGNPTGDSVADGQFIDINKLSRTEWY